MLAEKFFVDIANCILKDNIHPVFWQYTVICCAFMRFVCKYGGKVREIYSFLAVGKRGKGKALLQTLVLVRVKRYANVLFPKWWALFFIFSTFMKERKITSLK